MSDIEALFHELDKQQSNFEIKATQIFSDHSEEINRLRGKMDTVIDRIHSSNLKTASIGGVSGLSVTILMLVLGKVFNVL